MFGVSIKAPKEPKLAKPASSASQLRTFGAPSGALTASGHCGVDSSKRGAILPVKGGSSLGSAGPSDAVCASDVLSITTSGTVIEAINVADRIINCATPSTIYPPG